VTRVTVVSPEPTPYRAPLFDRIAQRVDLTVVYAAHTVAGRGWTVPLDHRAVFLRGVRVPGVRRLVRHDYPVTPVPGQRPALREPQLLQVVHQAHDRARVVPELLAELPLPGALHRDQVAHQRVMAQPEAVLGQNRVEHAPGPQAESVQEVAGVRVQSTHPRRVPVCLSDL